MPWKNEREDQHGRDDKPKSDWGNQLETLLSMGWHECQDYFRVHFKKIMSYTGLAIVSGWLVSGIYIVDQGNRGVVTRFGAYNATTMPGPHWHIPFPIEDVAVVNVEKQRFIEVGYRSGARNMAEGSALPESLMLTKDENIVSVRLAIQYQIKNARDYLFNVKDSEATLKQVTESIERGVIGRNNMDFILTEGRSQIVTEIKDAVQQAMDQYRTGLRVASVNLQDAQPPEEVQGAFEDAIRAREDKQRLINEAEAYANEVIPKARGAAGRLIQEAEAYEAQVVAKAKGESERFEQLLTEYEKAPKITRKRLYLEAKEKLYSNTNKVLVNMERGNSMFYLPLNQVAQQTVRADGSKIDVEKQLDVDAAGTNANKRTSVKHSNIRSSRSRL
ncbi:MAG: FtsH protease activity modulator HflK [Gammaproteobacteria bacterium]